VPEWVRASVGVIIVVYPRYRMRPKPCRQGTEACNPKADIRRGEATEWIQVIPGRAYRAGVDCMSGSVQQMINPSQFRVIVNEMMRNAGFSKERKFWVVRQGGIGWKLGLDRSSFGERFSIEIGVAPTRFLEGIEPSSPNDFPIILWLENMTIMGDPGGGERKINDFRSAVVASFDLSVSMSDDERKRLIYFIIGSLHSYIVGISDEDEFRSRYKNSEFKSAFIRKDARSFLEE
jgi:hypothetical protein